MAPSGSLPPLKSLHPQPDTEDVESVKEQGSLTGLSQPRETRVAIMRTFASLVLLSVLATLLVLSPLSASGSPAPALAEEAERKPIEPVKSFLSEWTAPAAFPTSAFRSYYEQPSGTLKEPRPIISDVNRGGVFPKSLDQPFPWPTGPPSQDAVFPRPSSTATSPKALESAVRANLTALLADPAPDSCSKCVSALRLGQTLARGAPSAVPGVLIDLCTQFNVSTTSSGLSQRESCVRTYAPANFGSPYAQILSYADFSDASTDAQYICHNVVKGAPCALPAPRELGKEFLDAWFGGKKKRAELLKRQEAPRAEEKRAGPKMQKRSAGKKHDGVLRLLHMSDIHVDPRFFIGGEGACTSGQCCRADSFNSTVASGPPSPLGSFLPAANLSDPAVYWGNYRCDAPWPLALSALQAVNAVNGGQDVDFSLYTGDMVTHDSTWHLSRDLVSYTQQSIFDSMKRFLGSGPVFSAIGNHDTAPSDFANPNSFPSETRDQYSYDWKNLARLFHAEGWFTHAEAKQVSRHYGGYSVSPRKGLRVITLNTDFWYRGNTFNYVNTTNPDVSGSLRWATDELLAAERRKERVWIVGHVLTGWDGSNPLDNPTNLFYQIVDHFAPRTIAHIFFGHTHEDQFNLFYAKNGTSLATPNAKAVSFMGPSVTPGNGVNSAFRIYSVDATMYEVLDYDQYYTPVDAFATLPRTGHGPVWKHEYSARDIYANFSRSVAKGTYSAGVPLVDNTAWPADAPLNATFWAAVTDEMEAELSLVDAFRLRQGRQSPKIKLCPDDNCRKAMICYMRSGSSIIGRQCPPGYASVQS